MMRARTTLDRDKYTPALLPGVQLVQTAVNVVHLVGDTDSPVSLVGAGSDCLRWLNQLDGGLSWDAQVWQAESLGVSAELAESVLGQLESAGLVVDCSVLVISRNRFERANLFGGGAVADVLGDLCPRTVRRGEIPSPRTSADWRQEIEEQADDVGANPVVVVLSAPGPSSSEVDFVSHLVSRGIRHLVVAAGQQSARVGPYTGTTAGPCLRCDSLAHTDSDEVWRQIGAQMSLDAPTPLGPSVLLATLAAAEAARQMVALDAGYPATAENAVMQSGYRGGAWRRRLLVRHQQCSCWWPRSAGEN